MSGRMKTYTVTVREVRELRFDVTARSVDGVYETDPANFTDRSAETLDWTITDVEEQRP